MKTKKLKYFKCQDCLRLFTSRLDSFTYCKYCSSKKIITVSSSAIKRKCVSCKKKSIPLTNAKYCFSCDHKMRLIVTKKGEKK
ncbi:hypothetical protein GOV12_02285 [Candidatus Pacearchaeota archaeon]|nr:hypothetical protein [Candidatus Pacearchaeota archaeon]